MGVRDLVARDKKHYVEIAVRMATDLVARQDVRQRLMRRLPLLFRRDEAVQAWTDLLRRIAPDPVRSTIPSVGSDRAAADSQRDPRGWADPSTAGATRRIPKSEL
jgi:hypothetical protein